MAEPVTTNKFLIVPNTGDLPGTWGTAALNPNFQVIDSLFGGVVTIALSSATSILLTTPSTTGDWGGTVGQSANAMIVFTGAQTGSAVILFSLPGFYIVNNRCTGTTFVQLAPATGAGTKIGAPPGEKCHVFFDGTNMDYVDMGRVGSALDLHGVSTTPPWMSACTNLPYLIKDGTVFSALQYPALAALLGNTFGGNGVTTFGVPDERGRVRIGFDSGGGSGRITVGGAGFSAGSMGAAGGSQFMQLHQHTATLVDPTHAHTYNRLTLAPGAGCVAGTGFAFTEVPTDTTSNLTGLTAVVNNTGSGLSQNVQPSIVDFLPMIKT